MVTSPIGLNEGSAICATQCASLQIAGDFECLKLLVLYYLIYIVSDTITF